MDLKSKKVNVRLGFKMFRAKNGHQYLVFRTAEDAFHVFTEVEAKEAARSCGATGNQTREMWKELWGDEGEGESI